MFNEKSKNPFIIKIKINGINKKLLSQVDGENCGYNNQLEIQKTNKFVNLLVP